MNRLRPTPVAACALLLALPFVLLSCQRHTVQRYTGRGRVAQLPGPQGSRLLYLQHEAIAGYRDRLGNVVGMSAMTMPFPLAPDASLAGIAVGDAVAFDLRVDWQAETEVEITQVRKLPAGTRLVFTEAPPAR
ncbi:MAG TPA: copper-binding protein [Thermoanaerobaculia bacterium]